MPLSIAPETPIARMDRIARSELPTLPAPPQEPPSTELDRWKAMAQGYASLCIRQREFEDAIISEFKRNDTRLSRIEQLLESIIVEETVDADGGGAFDSREPHPPPGP